MIGHTSRQTLKCTHGLLNLICKEIGSSVQGSHHIPSKAQIPYRSLLNLPWPATEALAWGSPYSLWTLILIPSCPVTPLGTIFPALFIWQPCLAPSFLLEASADPPRLGSALPCVLCTGFCLSTFLIMLSPCAWAAPSLDGKQLLRSDLSLPALDSQPWTWCTIDAP